MRVLFIPALVVGALVIAAVMVAWHPWPRAKVIPLDPSGKPSLAVMYFENNTGDEDLDHWRKGISDLLITDLTQSKYLKVLGGDKLINILGQMDQLEAKSYSSEVLKQLAVQGGVNHIARGSYSRAGEIIRIDIVLQEALSGEPIATQSIEGQGQEGIFDMVDELTKWTKASLKLSAEQMTSDLDMGIGDVTTSSPEAYKFYIEGRRLFNKHEFQQSIEFMEKAIALDSGFAMAFRSMAQSFGHLGKLDERSKYLQKAFDLSDRLTEKEKLLVQGDTFVWVHSDSTWDKAIEAYKKHLNLYPETTGAFSANHNLGFVYSRIEDWDKAIECNETIVKARTDFFGSYYNLYRAYTARGEYDKAEEILEEYTSRFPDNPSGYWNFAMLYAYQGQFALALKEADKAAAFDPTYNKAIIYHMLGDFIKAEEGYKKGLEHVSQSDHLSARTQLGSLYLTQGRFEASKSQILQGIDLAEKLGSSNRDLYRNLAYHFLRSGKLEEALEAFEKTWTIGGKNVPTDSKISDQGLKGWIYTEMGRLDEAQNAAEEIKKLVAASLFEKKIREYHFLMGMIELKKESYSDAVEYFNNAISLLHHPSSYASDHYVYEYYLALAYYESGDLEKALDVFEGIAESSFVSTSYGDLYAQSYYMLGKIHEQQGDTAKSIEHYEKFLTLWNDADPGLPEVADARERVAALRQ